VGKEHLAQIIANALAQDAGQVDEGKDRRRLEKVKSESRNDVASTAARKPTVQTL
jgi:hypothetical protein